MLPVWLTAEHTCNTYVHKCCLPYDSPSMITTLWNLLLLFFTNYLGPHKFHFNVSVIVRSLFFEEYIWFEELVKYYLEPYLLKDKRWNLWDRCLLGCFIYGFGSASHGCKAHSRNNKGTKVIGLRTSNLHGTYTFKFIPCFLKSIRF